MTREIGKGFCALVVTGAIGAAGLPAIAIGQGNGGATLATPPEKRLAMPASKMAEQMTSGTMEKQSAARASTLIKDATGSVHYLVTFADDASLGYSNKAVGDPRFGAEHDGKVMRLLHNVEAKYRVAATHAFSHTLRGFAAYLTVQQLEQLRRDPRIKSVVPNAPAESSAGAVWNDVQVGGSTLPWGIQAVGGGKSSTGAATVYVIDSGIANHVDLKVSARWNAPNACLIGKYPHATFVAGIIAAANNNIGVTGVNAGANLVSLAYGDPTCGANNANIANVIAAMDEAKRRIQLAGKVGVVNLSSNFSAVDAMAPAFRQSVRSLITPNSATGYPGAFFVQSAGNRYLDACQWSFNDRLPADGAMVIGAIDSNGQPVQPLNGDKAFNPEGVAPEMGSNFGACIDAWAPGKLVRSAWMNSYASTYITSSGTSWAAPHVAGVAAYLIETMPGLRTPADVETAVRARLVNGGALSRSLPVQSPNLNGSAHTARPTVEFKIGTLTSSPTPATLAQYSNSGFVLRYDSVGAQNCDLKAYLNGNLWYQIPAFQASYNWGSVVLNPGLYRWDVSCRSPSGVMSNASASANVVQAPPPTTFSINGVATSQRTIPTAEAFVLAYSAPSATSCAITAYRALPVGFWEFWYSNPNIPASYSWGTIRLDPGKYHWSITCSNANDPTQPASGATLEVNSY